MADTAVSLLLNNLSQLLKDEAKLLPGMEEKVKLLQEDLERINGFLRDSEGKRDEHEKVKVVIHQIRDMAYEAQDVIDNYIADVVNHRRKGMLEKFFSSFDHGNMLHSVNNQIETIKSKIKDIYDNEDKYDINEGESAAANMEDTVVAEKVQSRRSNVEEDEVVGFDVYADEVVMLLVKGSTSLEVVSIVGMVGCGKTTLARKVYRDPLLNKLFDCCTWDFVTKEFNAKEFMISLLRRFKAISEDELKRNEREIAILKNMLREYLSDMRYLIILDNVWSSQVWEEIRDAFLDDKMGSRILITTRSEEVASKIFIAEPYELKPLSKKDSWILLSKKVFRGEKCPPDLEVAGKNIVIACKGLPLSIVVTAGILRSKEKLELVWEKVPENVNWYISHYDTLVKDKVLNLGLEPKSGPRYPQYLQHSISTAQCILNIRNAIHLQPQFKTLVKEIVRLGYESLPRKLKPCFLYFGIYPEDYDVPVRQLIQLWIAEGFISEKGHGTMTQEDVAEEYLHQLISCNLIQVESRRMDGGVKTCRIHDLVQEICMSECIEDKFLEVCTDISISKEGKPRRLSLHGSTTYYMSESPCDHSSTRSLFNFNKDEYDVYNFREWHRKNFKLMRVLDMGLVKHSSYALGKLEELIHLRYLRTRDNGSFSFSSSIYNLLNLETLDLRGSRTDALPDGIWKLKRLRHFYMLGKDTSLPEIHGRKIFPNLQTLSTVRLDQKTANQLQKGTFSNLRKLGVDCSHFLASNPIDFLRKFQNLSHLNTLKVFNGKCALRSVQGFAPNITKITLVGGICLDQILSPLKSLHKLRYLKISSDDSDHLRRFALDFIEPGSFPQLQELKMTGLDIKKWNLGKGTMPQLRNLAISRCELSDTLPRAHSLATLREVEVLWSSKELVDMLQHMVLKDACKLTVYP